MPYTKNRGQRRNLETSANKRILGRGEIAWLCSLVVLLKVFPSSYPLDSSQPLSGSSFSDSKTNRPPWGSCAVCHSGFLGWFSSSLPSSDRDRERSQQRFQTWSHGPYHPLSTDRPVAYNQYKNLSLCWLGTCKTWAHYQQNHCSRPCWKRFLSGNRV